MPDAPVSSPPFGFFAPRGVVLFASHVARRCARGWWARRVAYAMRALAMTGLNGRPLDVEALGARMRLFPSRSVAEKRLAFTPQYFDPDERAFLAGRLVGDFVFIDLGASCGGYALFAAGLAGARARILAVEPQPQLFERLVNNIRESGFFNVKAVGCAALDIDGEATLFVNSANEGESSVRFVNADQRVDEVRVPAKTLLTLARDEGFTRIDAIKVDIEGAEPLALEPFFSAAPRPLWPRAIVLAYRLLRPGDGLEALIERLGYREALRTRMNVAYVLEGE